MESFNKAKLKGSFHQVTCEGLICVELGSAAHAGRIQGLNAERLQKVPQLLDVAVLAV